MVSLGENAVSRVANEVWCTTRDTIYLQITYGGNDELIHDSDVAEEEVKPTQSSKRKITKQYLEEKKLQILKDVQTRWRWPNRRNPKKNKKHFCFCPV